MIHTWPRRGQQHRRRLIIGGRPATPGRYPYFASIDKNNGVVLNGALVARDIVLTAGHVCTTDMARVTLRVGTYDLDADVDAIGNATVVGAPVPVVAEEIPVLGFIMHANWSQFAPEYFAYDFCLLRLARQAARADPVRLNRSPGVPASGDDVLMLGLGWMNASYPSPSRVVRQVRLRTVSNEACGNVTDPYRGLSYEGLIVPSMLCTVAPPNTTRDGCAWDSGAPVLTTDDSRGDPTDDLLVGLGSTGIGCADPEFPSIQARVSDGYDWIVRQVCRLSTDPPRHFDCRRYRHDHDAMGPPTAAPIDARVRLFHTRAKAAPSMATEPALLSSTLHGAATRGRQRLTKASPLLFAAALAVALALLLAATRGLIVRRRRQRYERTELLENRERPDYRTMES